MYGKCLSLVILLILTLVFSVVVMVEVWDSPESNCTANCDRPSIYKIMSLISWFFAWEVGLIMLLHVSLTCLSTEADGYLPTVSGVLMYCVASFIFFSSGFILSRERGYTPHVNTTVASFNDTEKEETVVTHKDNTFIYRSLLMLAAIVGFSVYSLIVCGLMYTPRCKTNTKPQKQKMCIIDAGCKSISTIAKDLGRMIEKPRSVQLPA